MNKEAVALAIISNGKEMIPTFYGEFELTANDLKLVTLNSQTPAPTQTELPDS